MKLPRLLTLALSEHLVERKQDRLTVGWELSNLEAHKKKERHEFAPLFVLQIFDSKVVKRSAYERLRRATKPAAPRTRRTADDGSGTTSPPVPVNVAVPNEGARMLSGSWSAP